MRPLCKHEAKVHFFPFDFVCIGNMKVKRLSYNVYLFLRDIPQSLPKNIQNHPKMIKYYNIYSLCFILYQQSEGG